jgi:hypothetical protein
MVLGGATGEGGVEQSVLDVLARGQTKSRACGIGIGSDSVKNLIPIGAVRQGRVANDADPGSDVIGTALLRGVRRRSVTIDRVDALHAGTTPAEAAGGVGRDEHRLLADADGLAGSGRRYAGRENLTDVERRRGRRDVRLQITDSDVVLVVRRVLVELEEAVVVDGERRPRDESKSRDD